jgi:hypothetical protein
VQVSRQERINRAQLQRRPLLRRTASIDWFREPSACNTPGLTIVVILGRDENGCGRVSDEQFAISRQSVPLAESPKNGSR